MEGQIVGGRYEVVRELGRGGMGAVYEARHTGTGRRVAVKVITADLARSPGLLQRFEVEARAGGGIDSQYIAQVLDTGTDEAGSPYIVMEYLVGEDLFQLLNRITPLPVNLALRIVAQACLGLEKAHQTKIVHRDIKPANIFLNEREGDEIGAKILDFGVAKVFLDDGQSANALTRTGSLLGSPLYMSPEQARGDKLVDHRSDVWSLGVVLYESLCGVTPFHEIEALGSLIIAICGEAPTPIQKRAPWVPPQVATLLHKALAQKPEQRFQSAYEMYRAIKAIVPNSTTAIDKSMIVPISDDERSFVAQPMSSTEPALSTSTPGTFEEQQARVIVTPQSMRPPPAPTGPESMIEGTMRSEPARPMDRPPPSVMGPRSTSSTRSQVPSSPGSTASPSGPSGAGVALGESAARARTTGGITSESSPKLSVPPPSSASAKSFIPYAAGAVLLAGVAAFAGMRLGSREGTPPAAATGQVTVETPKLPVTASTSPTPTVVPQVVPAPSVSASASASASPTTSASAVPVGPAAPVPGGPLPGHGKAPPKGTAAPGTPATASTVGGRIIQTDL